MKIGYLKPGILLLVLLFSFRQDLFAKKRITSLKCEYIEAPLGLDVQRPRLMWKVDTSMCPVGKRPIGFWSLLLRNCCDKERLISGIPANRSRMSNWFLTPGVRCVLTPDTGGG